MSNKLVYIILVNYNNYIDTFNCINSINNSNYKYFKIIVVDNNSSDNSFSLLNQSFSSRKNVILLKSNRNGGFSYGNNIGIKYALKHKVDYLWILNNDTIIKKNTLKKLVTKINSDFKIGCIGLTIKYFNSELVHTYGGGKLYLNFGFIRRFKEYNSFPDYISGTSMFIKKEVFNDIGLFDESFFMYWEDVDLSIRISEKWHLDVEKKAVIHHKISSSVPKKNNKRDFFFEENNFKSLIILLKKRVRLHFIPISLAYFLRLIKRIICFKLNNCRIITRIYFNYILGQKY